MTARLTTSDIALEPGLAWPPWGGLAAVSWNFAQRCIGSFGKFALEFQRLAFLGHLAFFLTASSFRVGFVIGVSWFVRSVLKRSTEFWRGGSRGVGNVQSMSNSCSVGFRCGLLVATRVPRVIEKVEVG